MVRKKWIAIVMSICWLSVLSSYQVIAEETGFLEEESAIVFLIDASNSMNDYDPNRLAIDTVAQLIYSLPSNYQVGLVVYNNDIVVSSELVQANQREALIQQAESITYTGYTNAGEALDKALAILSNTSLMNKTLIILSDGEIIMEGEEATYNSSVKFYEGVEKAQQENIPIHVIGLGETMENNENTIFLASEKTGGQQYYAPSDTHLQKVVDTLLLDVFKIKKMTTALIDATGEQETSVIDLPIEHVSNARILITSQEPITSLQANFTAERGQVHNGKHYSVIELNRPAKGPIDIRFQGQKGSQIRMDIITEYEVIPKAEITYVDTELDDRIQRLARISLAFYDGTNVNLPLFTETFFDKSLLPLVMNDEEITGVIEDGIVTFEKEIIEDDLWDISIDYTKLPANIVASEPIQVSLEGPPELVQPPDNRPLWLMGSLFVLFIGGIIVGVIVKYRHQSKSHIEPAIPLPSKYSYYGKFNIYVTLSPSGEDISPRTYDLFRVPASEVLSLKKIIEQCQIQEVFEGAEQIFFRSGANRTLTLINHSDCTLLKNRELLMKDHSYQILLDERIDITFEDERSELVLQYRPVRPNERSG